MKKRVFMLLICMIVIFSTFSFTALACDNCLGDASYYEATGGITGTYVSLRKHHNNFGDDSENVLGYLQPGDWIYITYFYWNSNYEFPGWYYGQVSTNSVLNGWNGWVCSKYVRTYDE